MVDVVELHRVANDATECDVDHIQAYEDGGLTTQANGRLACGPHNRHHHDTKTTTRHPKNKVRRAKNNHGAENRNGAKDHRLKKQRKRRSSQRRSAPDEARPNTA